jgi:hypothetical protein
MTLTEKELLTRFLQQLASANAGQKDAEAEALIKEAVARQPDAAYLLTQRALQLEQLLQASQDQLKALQSDLDQSRAGSSRGFLADPNAWGARPAAAPSQQPLGARSLGSRAAPAPQGGSWATGLFGNIAATAAGVVAGSFLFQGIQGMMNRGESASLADNSPLSDPSSQPAEPELLNSFDTAEGESGDMFADLIWTTRGISSERHDSCTYGGFFR